jgi:hypothetical protein
MTLAGDVVLGELVAVRASAINDNGEIDATTSAGHAVLLTQNGRTPFQVCLAKGVSGIWG